MKIASFGELAMIFISGLGLVSIHPSETIVTLELLHEARIGVKTSSKSVMSFLRRSVRILS